MVEKHEDRISKVIEHDGEKIFGILHMPKSTLPNIPLVVIFHGFASSKIGTARSHVKLAIRLAKRGIASFRFDFRCHGDSEGDLSKVGFDGLVADACHITSTLKNEGFSKIGFFGSSLGASIALISAAELGGISAIAVWAPVASGRLWLKDHMQREPQSRRLNSYQGLAVSSLFRSQFFKMNASNALLSLHDVPLMHLQGEKDEAISMNHKRVFEEKRADAKSPSCFRTFAGASHYLGHSHELPEIADTIENWLSEHLLGHS